MAVELKKRKISREAYHVMIDAGIFGPEDKIELLNGEIIDMSPVGNPHIGTINWLSQLFIQKLAGKAIVSIQNPINLSEFSEPEPDLVVCKYRDDFYKHERIKAQDILLLIEVSDTTLEKDREVKFPLYAEAGIECCWIVNLTSKQLEVYTYPEKGKYQNSQVYAEGEIVALENFGLEFSLSDLFG